MELNIKDLKHIKNYLVLAGRYLVDQFNNETDLDMADLISDEIDLVSNYITRINNILNSFE